MRKCWFLFCIVWSRADMEQEQEKQHKTICLNASSQAVTNHIPTNLAVLVPILTLTRHRDYLCYDALLDKTTRSLTRDHHWQDIICKRGLYNVLTSNTHQLRIKIHNTLLAFSLVTTLISGMLLILASRQPFQSDTSEMYSINFPGQMHHYLTFTISV